MNENTDVRLDYPATGRNQEVILDVLKEALPKSGAVLEVASGSGQHITYFAQQIPQLKWQPSDIEAAARASIDAWRNEMGVTEAVHTPIDLMPMSSSQIADVENEERDSEDGSSLS